MEKVEPVTVVIARRVKPGKESEYEDWVRHIISVGSTFPGHSGVDVLKPSSGTGGEYILITRFDNYENQRVWEESNERTELLKELDPITEGDAQITKATGLESWFSLPEVPKQAVANRHKMTVVIAVSIFFLVLLVNFLFKPILDQLPYILKVAVLSVIQVAMLSYVVLPRVTALLKNWLYPSLK
ncbi:MAG: antibiotic biosynthesis monooxygenase [Gammaproteobacteria bacterium]